MKPSHFLDSLLLLCVWQISEAFTTGVPSTPSLSAWSTLQDFQAPSLISPLYAKHKKSDENSNDKNPRRQKTWDERIKELEKYKKEFETVNVPFRHIKRKDEWASLATWAKSVREGQGRLSQEQHEQLTSMGFTFKGVKEEKEDQKWAEMFERLEQYNITHRHNRVPQNYTLDPSLATWVMNQRKAKMQGVLKPERIEKLNSIKFEWQLRWWGRTITPKEEKIWFENLANLTKFHEENSHYWPPRRSSNTTIRKLGTWVADQRRNKKKGTLFEYREQELERIEFPWDDTQSKESKWFAKFDKIKEVVQQGKREGLDGSVFAVSVLGKNLYKLYKQQTLYLKGELDPKRKSLLDSIGFEWPPEESQ